MPYWRATVERPDGDGGWITVGVYGTPDTPGKGTARYLSAADPLDAARTVLDHVWPVNLEDFNARKDDGKWADLRKAKTGIADHRITMDVDGTTRWSHDVDVPPEPQTFTVAEIRLADVRAEAEALTAERAQLKELTDQVQKLRSDVRHRKWLLGNAQEEAIRAGVDESQVAKAGRSPRPPRKPSARRN